MKPRKAKLSPANIVEHILREIVGQPWDKEIIMKAGQATGDVQAKTRYAPREFSCVLSRLCRKVLKVFGLNKAERKPRGPVAWRRKLFELWTSGELTVEMVAAMVRDDAVALAAKCKPSDPQVLKRRTWASSGANLGAEFRIDHATGVAICKAIEHMVRWSGGFMGGEPFRGERITRQVNEMIRAAAEAVTNFIPSSPLGFRVPYVFKARDETNAEREMRLMLDALCK